MVNLSVILFLLSEVLYLRLDPMPDEAAIRATYSTYRTPRCTLAQKGRQGLQVPYALPHLCKVMRRTQSKKGTSLQAPFIRLSFNVFNQGPRFIWTLFSFVPISCFQ